MKRCYLLAAVMLACGGTSSSSPDPAADPSADSAKADTTKATRKTEAAHIVWLLTQSGASAITCKTKDGKNTITIKKGINPDDKLGLVVLNDSGDYSYGTDQIGEIYSHENTMIQWGEEGNYLLTVPNLAWNLFNYGGTSKKPALATDVSTAGSVIAEQESVAAVDCTAK